MNELVRLFGPAGIVILALGGMLKFLVVDKLTTITEALGSHEKRIRKMENRSAALHGALAAKGCLLADSCMNDESDEAA